MSAGKFDPGPAWPGSMSAESEAMLDQMEARFALVPERHSAACYDDQGKCECVCGIEEFRMWADDQENRC